MADTFDGKQDRIGPVRHAAKFGHALFGAAIVVNEAAVALFDDAAKMGHMLMSSANHQDAPAAEIDPTTGQRSVL